MTVPVALTVAGSDSGGGAGIQADIRAFSRLGVHPCTVITALTAQNTVGVQGVYPVSVDFLVEQLESVLSDIKLSAVKTGMLFSAELIEQVAARAQSFPWLVVDPVMVAESGDSLLQSSARQKLVNELLPKADLITPNWPETEVIAGELGISLELPPEQLGHQIQQALSGPAVLIKGGHRPEKEAVDLLFESSGSQPLKISTPRLNSSNTHGTGCTYSSLITGFLARGLQLVESIRQAKKFQQRALENGYEYGQGAGTINTLSRGLLPDN